MEEVKRDVLSWDVDGILAPAAHGKAFTKIPTTFESLEQYSRIFWKLLTEELRAHVQQVSLKAQFERFVIILNFMISKVTQSTSNFLSISLRMILSCFPD